MRDEIRKIHDLMEEAQYVTDAPVATSVHLAMTLRKPLLIEGHAGVGKTEVAKVMARMLDTRLIRLQCYEGLDASTALYEWNYQKQLLHIKLAEGAKRGVDEQEHEIFSESFLLRRPLLQAITQKDKSPVLLVDEVDRCVAARTLITTTSGIKRAEEIQPGDELMSFDPRGFRMTIGRVKKVVPRKAPRMLRIIAGGRLIEVTEEHKFLRDTAVGCEVIPASELQRGDRLPLFKRPRFSAVCEPQFNVSDEIVKLTSQGWLVLRRAYESSERTYADIAGAVGVSRNHLRNVLPPHPVRHSFRFGTLGKLAAELAVDDSILQPCHSGGLRVRQTVAFYEVLGYITADGCFTSDRLAIADKDRTNLEVYAEKFAEAFGVRPRIVNGPHRNYELTYHSLPLGRFLRRVLGPGMVRSRNRMVPEFVFTLPVEKRAGFVRGFFDGEGWVGDHQVCATSASPYLLVGIQHLLSSLGIDSHISAIGARPRSFGKGPYYTLTVSDVRSFVDAVGFCAPAKASRVQEAPSQEWAVTETLPEQPIFAGLNALRAREVPNGRPSHQTIHDILARRVKPNVSSLRRIANEFECPELDDLLDSDVVLGELRSIEAVEGEHDVYDFVMEDDPYFVANQIITHNCDEEFEAFMLEVFAEWQVTIPEIGTITATHPPHVVLTSNRTRELSDALRRRCLYLWIDYPSYDKELRIVERKVPGLNLRLASEVARFMESLRRVRLAKVPGVAETLDWAHALASLHADHLEASLITETLGCVLKDADDIKRFSAEVAKSGLASFLPAQG